MRFENPFLAGFWLAFGGCCGLLVFGLVPYVFVVTILGITLAG